MLAGRYTPVREIDQETQNNTFEEVLSGERNGDLDRVGTTVGRQYLIIALVLAIHSGNFLQDCLIVTLLNTVLILVFRHTHFLFQKQRRKPWSPNTED